MEIVPRLCTIALGAALAAPLLAGCGSGPSNSGKPTVVASFYPLQYVAQRIVGNHANVTSLTNPGVEPHDIELHVQQTAEIADADVVFYERGFQAAVDQAVDQNGPDRVLDVSDVVELEQANRGNGDAADELDPHFWLNPNLMVQAARAFKNEMSQADPQHDADYSANFERLRSDLEKLDKDLTVGLANCAIDTTVVSHDAFGYLSTYGLNFVSINGLSPDAEPSPAHIRQLHDLIESDGITTVFSETLASPKMAETLSRDLGVKTAVLDPIEGLGDATADEDYLSLMRKNLAALETANQCT